jgi:hypothetical protein
MFTVAEIKAAAGKLPVAERLKLFEHLAHDAAIRRQQLARLRAEINKGVRDHEAGRFIEITSAAAHRGFFADIRNRGRVRLAQSA